MSRLRDRLERFFRRPQSDPPAGGEVTSDFRCPPPREFFLETGNICNLRCPFCGTGLRRKDTERGFLRKNDFAVILEKIAPYTDHLSFYNYGEPFLNPEFLEMVRLAGERGVRCSTHSNLTATAFDEAAARAVVESGLIFLSASIDGASQETYDRYRVGGSFERALANLAELSRAKEKLGSPTPRLVWKFLINRFNEHEQDAARHLAAEIGVEIEFHLMDVWGHEEWKSSLHRQQEVWGKEKQDSRILTGVETEHAVPRPLPVARDDLDLHPALHYWCEQPFTAMIINWNGEVFPCCTVCDDRFSLGNLLTAELMELWNNRHYRACREFLYHYGPRQQSEAPCARFPCELRLKHLDQARG